MENIKRRKHPVLDIPVLGPVIGCFLAFVISEVFGGMLIGIPLDMIVRGVTLHQLMDQTADLVFTGYAAALGGILMIFIHKAWFQGEFRGGFSGYPGDAGTRRIVLAVIAILILTIAESYASHGIKAPTAATPGQALMAGICEEVCFRLVLISLLMRKSADRKSVFNAVIISSVVFGVIHFSNLTSQSGAGTVLQVLFAWGVGIFFAALYLRTGNLLPNIIIHTVYDFMAFLQSSASGMTVDVAGQGTVSIVVSIAATVFCLVSGLLLIRGHAGEIETVWNDRWNRRI